MLQESFIKHLLSNSSLNCPLLYNHLLKFTKNDTQTLIMTKSSMGALFFTMTIHLFIIMLLQNIILTTPQRSKWRVLLFLSSDMDNFV